MAEESNFDQTKRNILMAMIRTSPLIQHMETIGEYGAPIVAKGEAIFSALKNWLFKPQTTGTGTLPTGMSEEQYRQWLLQQKLLGQQMQAQQAQRDKGY